MAAVTSVLNLDTSVAFLTPVLVCAARLPGRRGTPSLRRPAPLRRRRPPAARVQPDQSHRPWPPPPFGETGPADGLASLRSGLATLGAEGPPSAAFPDNPQVFRLSSPGPNSDGCGGGASPGYQCECVRAPHLQGWVGRSIGGGVGPGFSVPFTPVGSRRLRLGGLPLRVASGPPGVALGRRPT
jgi:hypothetical protein